MIELILGALVVTGLIWCIAQATEDVVTAWRMSKAGEWDRIEQRKLRRAERVGKAWKAIRSRRDKAAGGDGDYRPGMYAYLNDLYHGFWERELLKSQATRPQKTQEAIRKKVANLREKSDRPVDDMLDVAQIRPDQQPDSPDREPEWLIPDPDEHLPAELCTRCRNGYVLTYTADGNEQCGNCGWLRDPPDPAPWEHADALPTEPADTRPDATVLPFRTTKGDTMATVAECKDRVADAAPLCPIDGQRMTPPAWATRDFQIDGSQARAWYTCPQCSEVKVLLVDLDRRQANHHSSPTTEFNGGSTMAEVTGLTAAIAHAENVAAAHAAHSTAGGEVYRNSLASYGVTGDTIGLAGRAQEASANAAAMWAELAAKLTEQTVVKEAYQQVPDAGTQEFVTNG